MQDEDAKLDPLITIQSDEDDHDDDNGHFSNTHSLHTLISSDDPFECFFVNNTFGMQRMLQGDNDLTGEEKERLTRMRKGISSSAWTEEEDELLESYCALYPRNWKFISLQFEKKTPKQCAYRYDKQHSTMSDNASKFSKIDDLELIQFIKKGMYDWSLIQKKMPKYSISELKTRLHCHLLPKTKKNLHKRKLVAESETSNSFSLKQEGQEAISKQTFEDTLITIKSLKSVFKILMKENKKILLEKCNVKMDMVQFVVFQKQEALFSELKQLINLIDSKRGLPLAKALSVNELQRKLIRLGKFIILLQKKIKSHS